jgi:heterodisulfide reductase subunit D
LFNLEQELKETKVRLCLDCGKCTVVCPVARYSPEFNPRLIIQKRLNRPLATNPVSGAGTLNRDSLDESIWSCLNCQMCLERCNYRVNFPEFVNALRAEAVSQGVRVKCSHGGALQATMHMMARKNLEQERLDWLPEDIILTEQSETRFFVGCAPYFDVIFKDIGITALDGVIGAMRLLNKADISFNLLANERCCGRDLLLQGDREGFLALAKANMTEFTRHGVKRIITYCPECYTCLKLEYPRALGQNGIQIVNLTELLAPLVKDKKLTLGGLAKRVTYHDPCTLGRGFRIFDAPRQLLTGLTGLKLVEMEDNRERSLCCGANPWAYCNAVNRQVQGQRLAQAKATGAEILVTACPKCQIHLKCAQKSGDCHVDQIEIQDLASLVAACWR